MRLDEACKLYGIIGPYLPDPLDEETVLQFTDRTFKVLVEHPKELLEALKILTHLSAEQLAQMSADELTKWWIDGLEESKILRMREYVEGMSNGK